MRCTDCNKPVKPVVAIDIDGTLGMYHEHFLTFAWGYFGVPFSLDYDGSTDLADFMGITKDDYRKCKLAYRQGGMKRTMPPYDGGENLVYALRSGGAEVWITTTRPYLRLDNVDPDTREWLDRQNIIYDGLIYDDDKYERLAEIVGAERVVGVLEDLPPLAERAEELGLNPILIRRKHNRGYHRHGLAIAGNLRDAYTMLQDRVRGWEKASAS